MNKYIVILATLLLTNCDPPYFPPGEGASLHQANKYPADVAVQWINLQQKLIKKTPGFDPAVSCRSFAYSGLTLYESIVKGMPGYQSLAPSLTGTNIPMPGPGLLHWPTSANAAMASMIKNLFASTSPANMITIDSLEAAFNDQFHNDASAIVLERSIAFGKKVADYIFEWSKTDGGHEAYKGAISSTYIPPTGPGLWIPTPPAFGQPVRPYWGDNRSFVPNSASITMPAPPISYSEDTNSGFYKMVNDVYNISVSLTPEDILTVKHWGDIPGNYNGAGHHTNIATQLIVLNNFKLDQAALAYAKHGMAIYDATICVFKAKYTYNLVRPISYIRGVMGQPTWNTVIATPPHPEYPAAHAVVGSASATILESFFGKHYSFIDYTHENLYGARPYNTIRDYAIEGGWSRVLAGIHYLPSVEAGWKQGEKVGNLVNKMPFKKSGK